LPESLAAASSLEGPASLRVAPPLLLPLTTIAPPPLLLPLVVGVPESLVSGGVAASAATVSSPGLDPQATRAREAETQSSVKATVGRKAWAAAVIGSNFLLARGLPPRDVGWTG